jgi:hypothetical protein
VLDNKVSFTEGENVAHKYNPWMRRGEALQFVHFLLTSQLAKTTIFFISVQVKDREAAMVTLQENEHVQQGVPKDDVLARHEGVLHLVTAADGALELYKSGETTDDSGNAVSSEQATGLSDQTMWGVWKGHGNHIQIRNIGNFQYKPEATA